MSASIQPDEVARETMRREVGRARVQAALDHIQQAQVELNLAMMDLCSVIGYVREGDQLAALHTKIKAIWYRVNTVFERGPTKAHKQINELDHTPSDKERANPHAGGCGRTHWHSEFFSRPPTFGILADITGREDLGLAPEGRVFRDTRTRQLYVEDPETKVLRELIPRVKDGIELFPTWNPTYLRIDWVSIPENEP